MSVLLECAACPEPYVGPQVRVREGYGHMLAYRLSWEPWGVQWDIPRVSEIPETFKNDRNTLLFPSTPCSAPARRAAAAGAPGAGSSQARPPGLCARPGAEGRLCSHPATTLHQQWWACVLTAVLNCCMRDGAP